MKVGVRLTALVIAAAVAFWVWRFFFPPPEAVIRHRLEKLAKAVSFSASEGELLKLARAQSVPDYFAPEVDVIIDVPGHERHEFTSRTDIGNAATTAAHLGQGLSVKFPDINVTVDRNAGSAMADATLNAHFAGEHDDIIEELQITFVQTNDDWLIQKVQTVQPVSLGR